MLDVGCGTGGNASLLLDRGCVVDGVTLSGEEAKKARTVCREVWLHNLADDPTEQANLADKMPAKVAELLAELDAINGQQVKPRWPSLLEGAIRIDQPLGQRQKPDGEYIYWAN